MKTIIKNLKDALRNNQLVQKYLNSHSRYSWQENYPIAIVHEQTRVKDPALLAKMDDAYFFGDDGFSQEMYTPKGIEFLNTHAPSYIKNASFLCFKGELAHACTFKEKFTHDKWKKVLNTQGFQATIEVSSFSLQDSIKTIETKLRDLMRSRKEIPSLKKIGFVWIAQVPKSTDLTDIMEHYFLENYEVLENEETRTYIAWNKTLNDINLRYFVVTP